MRGDRYITRPGQTKHEREVFDLHTGKVKAFMRGVEARERAESMAERLNEKEEQCSDRKKM